MTSLQLFSGGAAQGLVRQLDARFQAQQGCSISASFGAVGTMKGKLLAGSPCDVILLTKALIAQLTASGDVVVGSARSLGAVKTGIACKAGETPVTVDSPAALKGALQAASAIYFPDPVKATAGVHFMNVLRQLGLDIELADRLRPYPNGAAAMQALADAPGTGVIGCTQVTEILFAPGVQWVAPLPAGYELATTYTAAVCARSSRPDQAKALVELLAGKGTAAIRLQCGFEE